MSEFIQEEISVFLEAAWYGMFIAVFYDVLRVLRRVIKHSDIIVGIQDYLFWVIVGIVVFSMIFQSNDGIVRGYIFLALLIGAYVYNKSVSSFFVKYISKILNFILTLLLKKPLKWVKIIIRKMRKVLIKPFKKLAFMIKNLFRKSTQASAVSFEQSTQALDASYKGGKKHGKYNDKKKKKRKDGNIRH